MNIGLYFGTFNPIHIGHLKVANYMAEHTDLEEIWFVVSPHSPQKEKKALLEDHHRLEMVRIAIEDFPNLKASNIEFDLPQPNFTINTLVVLEEKYPSVDFCLIMGEDNLKSFHKWKNFETILENHHLYCYPRISEGEIKSNFNNHPKIHKIEAPIIELSASLIRNGIKNKKNVVPMLPIETWKYIDEMNFYRN